jgi:Fic family protein
MPELKFLVEKIDSLKLELEKLSPLKKEDEERVDKKFRLEWNYNSNHIEGNTLTYGQTELLLIFDKTTGDHEMREYEEMQAHDVAIKLVNEYANDKARDLTEADIRQWNKIILVKPYWGNAQTADGQPTRKLIQPGEYKKEPNSVRLQNGEMFHYASPEETPAKMKDLLGWLRRVSAEKKLHPVQIAAQLHYDFVRIHPFDDSNGRTSRLLMNYVLIQNGFPPVIIKSADKKGYLNALNKADVGDVNAFIEYVANQLIWSLEIFVKAAKGESIEEEDDLDKEIDVFNKAVKSKKKVEVKTLDSVENLCLTVVVPLYSSVLEKLQKLSSSVIFSRFNFNNGIGSWIILDQGTRISDIIKNSVLQLRQSFSYNESSFSQIQSYFALEIYFSGSSVTPESNFVYSKLLEFKLDMFYYEIVFDKKVLLKMNFTEVFSKEDLKEITKLVVMDVMKAIPKD